MKMEARRRVKVGGHELSCESAGRGASHFTCLHGLVDSLAIWDALMPLLSRRGRATRVDHRIFSNYLYPIIDIFLQISKTSFLRINFVFCSL